jgi:hypothetical protein
MNRRLLRLTGLATVLAGGWLASSATVPLYDGVGFPDQPYRYVSPPAGAKHGPAAKPAQGTAPVVGAKNGEELSVQSDEQGPQILLDLQPNSVTAPASAKTVILTATPQAPSAQPADGQIDGNVYRIAVTSDAGPAQFAAIAGDAVLYLRAASLKPAPPVMEFRAVGSTTWTPQHTVHSGNDVFAISFKGAGDYALVHQRGAHAASSGLSQESLLLILVGGFIVLIIVAAVLSRRPWQHTDGDEPADDDR